jgi:exopolyphosphatase/guanosine-5'-triphosphate,3'-diphosphate pyrophosphatase
VHAVATSAARRAANAADWLEALRGRTGLTVRVVSGQEEARLTYLGAVSHLPGVASPTAVVDLGGGSTEVVFGHAERIEYWISLEIGSVRATEACQALGRVEAHHRRALEELADVAIDGVALPGPPAAWVAVAATPTTLAAMHMGLEHYDAERVHGSLLDRSVLGEIAEQLTGIEPAARRELCRVSPERADYLVAGCTVLDRLLARYRAGFYCVSDRGLRFGLLEQTSQ